MKYYLYLCLLACACRAPILPPPAAAPADISGCWLHFDSTGFTLLHIVDTADLWYYHYYRGARFFECAGAFGFIDSSTVWIDTRYEVRQFHLRGDSLLQSDPESQSGPTVFLRMFNEDEIE